MKIRLLGRDITDDRFYLMIADSLDAFIEAGQEDTEENALSYATELLEDIQKLVDEATEDWIEENRKP